MAGEDLFGKLLLTVAVIVAAVPGLVIEPGPFSEVAALGALAVIWFGDPSEIGDL